MTIISYSGYHFPPEIIQRAIWLYRRFRLSFRDVESHFGTRVAADLRKRRAKPHAAWHLDEVYLRINGRMVYLWRVVDIGLIASFAAGGILMTSLPAPLITCVLAAAALIALVLDEVKALLFTRLRMV